jgi:hypothetical protein
LRSTNSIAAGFSSLLDSKLGFSNPLLGNASWSFGGILSSLNHGVVHGWLLGLECRQIRDGLGINLIGGELVIKNAGVFWEEL